MDKAPYHEFNLAAVEREMYLCDMLLIHSFGVAHNLSEQQILIDARERYDFLLNVREMIIRGKRAK